MSSSVVAHKLATRVVSVVLIGNSSGSFKVPESRSKKAGTAIGLKDTSVKYVIGL